MRLGLIGSSDGLLRQVLELAGWPVIDLRAVDLASTVTAVPEQVEIRAEQESDIETIRRVQTAAFGDDGRVAGLVDALRGAGTAAAAIFHRLRGRSGGRAGHAER